MNNYSINLEIPLSYLKVCDSADFLSILPDHKAFLRPKGVEVLGQNHLGTR